MHRQPPAWRDEAVSPDIRTRAWAETSGHGAASRRVQAVVERHGRVLSSAHPNSGPGVWMSPGMWP